MYTTSSNNEKIPLPLYHWTQTLAGGISIVTGLAALVLLSLWLSQYEGGFTVDESLPSQRFNLHPLSMMIAIPFGLNVAVLSWRILPFHHIVRKSVHVFFHCLAVAFFAAGLFFVVSTHTYPHIVSIHSWFGVTTAALIAIQFIIGTLSFLFPLPMLTDEFRVGIVPFHSWLGVTTFTMAMLTVCTGITEYVSMAAKTIGWNSTEMNIANSVGVLVYATLFITLYAVMPGRDIEAEADAMGKDVGGNIPGGSDVNAPVGGIGGIGMARARGPSGASGYGAL